MSVSTSEKAWHCEWQTASLVAELSKLNWPDQLLLQPCAEHGRSRRSHRGNVSPAGLGTLGWRGFCTLSNQTGRERSNSVRKWTASANCFSAVKPLQVTRRDDLGNSYGKNFPFRSTHGSGRLNMRNWWLKALHIIELNSSPAQNTCRNLRTWKQVQDMLTRVKTRRTIKQHDLLDVN